MRVPDFDTGAGENRGLSAAFIRCFVMVVREPIAGIILFRPTAPVQFPLIRSCHFDIPCNDQ
jgi:hypothetical protein